MHKRRQRAKGKRKRKEKRKMPTNVALIASPDGTHCAAFVAGVEVCAVVFEAGLPSPLAPLYAFPDGGAAIVVVPRGADWPIPLPRPAIDACDLTLQHRGWRVTCPRLVLVSATADVATVATPGRGVLLPLRAPARGEKRGGDGEAKCARVTHESLAALPAMTTLVDVRCAVSVDYAGRVSLVMEEEEEEATARALEAFAAEEEEPDGDGYSLAMAPPLRWLSLADFRVFAPATRVQPACDLEGCAQHTQMTPPERRCKRRTHFVYTALGYIGSKPGIAASVCPALVERAVGACADLAAKRSSTAVADAVRTHLAANALGLVQHRARPKKVEKGQHVQERRIVAARGPVSFAPSVQR